VVFHRAANWKNARKVLEKGHLWHHRCVLFLEKGQVSVIRSGDTVSFSQGFGGYQINQVNQRRTEPMIHKTPGGKVLLLAELDNGHLHNIISLKLDNLEAAKQVLGETVRRNKFDEALYGELMSEDNARDFVAGFDLSIAPYLAEALIREMDLSMLTRRYQELLGRKSKIKISLAQRRRLISQDSPRETIDMDDFDD